MRRRLACVVAASTLLWPLWQQRIDSRASSATSSTWQAPASFYGNEPPLASLPLPSPPAPPPPPPPSIKATAATPGWLDRASRATQVRDHPLDAWSHLSLPLKQPCIELSDVRKAHRHCLSLLGVGANITAEGPGNAATTAAAAMHGSLSCAQRSNEKMCKERAGPITTPTCTPAPEQWWPRAAASAAFQPRAAMAPPAVGGARAASWHAVVFGMAVYDSPNEQLLLQAAADTWLPMVRGADLVLMTDADDARNASVIAPVVRGVDVHVYRCHECRGQRCPASSSGGPACAGIREGWLARRKLLHLWVAIARAFDAQWTGAAASVVGDGDGDERSQSRKHFFVKVDPDTVPVPHHFVRLLAELRLTLGDQQAYLFGMAACRVPSFPLCHAAGGAGYGLSRGALRKLTRYIDHEYPAYLQRVDRFTYGGEDIAVAFALKKAAVRAPATTLSLFTAPPLHPPYRHLRALPLLPTRNSS